MKYLAAIATLFSLTISTQSRLRFRLVSVAALPRWVIRGSGFEDWGDVPRLPLCFSVASVVIPGAQIPL
jgi:hypothetical protein